MNIWGLTNNLNFIIYIGRRRYFPCNCINMCLVWFFFFFFIFRVVGGWGSVVVMCLHNFIDICQEYEMRREGLKSLHAGYMANGGIGEGTITSESILRTFNCV